MIKKFRLYMDFEVEIPDDAQPDPDMHQFLDPISAIEAATDDIGHTMMLLSDSGGVVCYGCTVRTDGVLHTRQTDPPIAE